MKKNRNIFKSYPSLQKIGFSDEDLKFKLFVGGLTPEVTSEELGNYFNLYGTVIGIKIVGEAANKSRGFGFVVFKDFNSIEQACSQDHFIRERMVDIMPSEESGLEDKIRQIKSRKKSYKKVFINKVPKHITKKQLSAYFAQFADVIEVLIIIRNKRPFAFSYISFGEKADLLKIVSQPHQITEEVTLKVEVAVPKENNNGKVQSIKKAKNSQKNSNNNTLFENNLKKKRESEFFEQKSRNQMNPIFKNKNYLNSQPKQLVSLNSYFFSYKAKTLKTKFKRFRPGLVITLMIPVGIII